MKNFIVVVLFLVSWGAFLTVGGTAGCGGGSGGDGSGDGSFETGTVTGTVSLADGVSLAALSTGRFLNVQTPSGIRVYVDGDDSLYGDTNSAGNFTIANVPSGRKCIRASARAVSNATYGFRRCFDVTASGADAGTVAMEEAGSLSGTVTLENASSNEGVLIYAAGTSYDAHTDSSGDFTISDMPPGEYDVTISMDGYSSRSYTSVFIYPGEETILSSVTLLESESCTEGGAVLAVTSSSQSADTVDIGESVTLSVEACSSLDFGIDYTWYEGVNCEDDSADMAIGTGSSYTFTSDNGDGGSTQGFCVKAEIDSNNVETVFYYVHTRNADYFDHVGRYEYEALASSNPNYEMLQGIYGIGKYGSYLYIQGAVDSERESGGIDIGTMGKVEIIDVSNPENPEYVDSLEYNRGTSSYESGMIVVDDKMFVQMCEDDGTHIYVYDLASNPTSPTLLTTLTNDDLTTDPVGNTCIVAYSPMIYNGQYLYVPLDNISSRVSIVDLATPSSPILMATLNEDGSQAYSPHTMAYYSNHLIIGNNENSSLDVWDVSNRASPSLTTTYNNGDWGPAQIPQILYSDAGKIYVSHDSSGLSVLDVTNVPTISSIQGIGGITVVNGWSCGGACSANFKIHNVGGYTLLAVDESNPILVYDADDLGAALGDIYSYVGFFDPQIFGVLSDDDYIYVVHTDGVDVYRK